MGELYNALSDAHKQLAEMQVQHAKITMMLFESQLKLDKCRHQRNEVVVNNYVTSDDMIRIMDQELGLERWS